MGTLGVFALIVLTTMVAAVVGVVVWLAMLPGRIAAQRQHPHIGVGYGVTQLRLATP
jgi:hypothetical protein